MLQADVQEIIKKVSTDNDLKKHLLSALGALSKDDEDFKKQLLNTLAVDLRADQREMSNLNLEKMRMQYAFWLAVIGLSLSAALVVFLFVVGMDSMQIGAIVGIFTGITGTLVGTFFGLQIGSSGRAEARADRRHMEIMAMRAMAALDPNTADAIMDKMGDG